MIEALEEITTARALSVREKLRKDLRALVFYTSPLTEAFADDPQWLAATHGMTVDRAIELRQQLFDSGLWVRDDSGKVRPRKSVTGLGASGSEDLTLPEFMTLVTQILCRVTEDGPCAAECYTIATSQELKSEFLSQIHLALRNLLERSKAAKGETVISWAHVYVDSMKVLRQESEL